MQPRLDFSATVALYGVLSRAGREGVPRSKVDVQIIATRRHSVVHADHKSAAYENSAQKCGLRNQA
jgi:hypothetical protein